MSEQYDPANPSHPSLEEMRAAPDKEVEKAIVSQLEIPYDFGGFDSVFELMQFAKMIKDTPGFEDRGADQDWHAAILKEISDRAKEE